MEAYQENEIRNWDFLARIITGKGISKPKKEVSNNNVSESIKNFNSFTKSNFKFK